MGEKVLADPEVSNPDQTSGGEARAVFANDAEPPDDDQPVKVHRESVVVPKGEFNQAGDRISNIQPLKIHGKDVDPLLFIRHEMNQQMVVLSLTQTILMRLLKGNDPEATVTVEQLKPHVETLGQSLETLTGLIREVRSDIRKVDPAVAIDELKPINISAFVEKLVAGWHALFDDQADITTEIEPDFEVEADKKALHEVLHNVFMNALEICHKNGVPRPKIHIRVQKFRDLVQIFVQDNGPGIKHEDKTKIFNPGYSTKGGHGLGLVRCDLLMQAMHGNLCLVNNVDRDDLAEDVRPKNGASAVIEIPLSRIPD